VRAHHGRVSSLPPLKAAVPARYRAAARSAFLGWASLVNTGSGVTCPVCERSFRKFARFHGANDQCPSCGSLMRHRALMLYLRDVMRVPESTRDVLHVGPEQAIRRWLASLPGVRYIATDLDPGRADIEADVTRLPFSDESFDMVICIHVLEHVPDDRAAIGELYRALRPGGTAVVQVPPSDLAETREDPSITDPRERQRLFGQHDHVRVCGADYVQRIAEPGFAVDVEDYVTRLDEETRERYGLRVGEPFYLCVKRASTA
jgi:SAM-dependent methyltransferase